ncbi:MAG: CDP-glucose 4,6-dehydratase [Bacteroidetes bacterium]|nr:CDP-glucose 4,6-dehydratase [Bacteroidota bacterium]
METVVTLGQLRNYYAGKNVFITGHTGFKGTWLTAVLHLCGAKVKGYALAPEHDYDMYFQLAPLTGGESVIADIRDRQRLQHELQAFRPDYIFHLAAQPLVRRSYGIPAETFEVNTTGTANLLEAAHGLSHPCHIVIITTDKVYENKEQHILYSEDDTLGGYDPYSASKAAAEIVVKSFRSSFFNPLQYAAHRKAVAVARAGNVIGGGDWSDNRLLPDIVRSLQKGETINVRNPNAVRPWQHVIEPLTGYLLLGGLLSARPASFSTAYNFGPYPEDHLTVRELVEQAIQSWGGGDWRDVSDPGQPHEAGLLQLSISKAVSELGWKPRLNSAAAIDRTIQWYRQPRDRQPEFTIRQIQNYFGE